MKNTLAIIFLAASSIVLYRSSNPKVKKEKLRWIIEDDGTFYHSSSHNCTFTSCYDTSRCVLNSSHVTFYIQPLVEFVDRNGTRISPVPSQEYLEIRRYLSPYSVQDPDLACLSFPGVDFLNFGRFQSEEHIQKIVAVLKNKLSNIIILNFWGKVPPLDAIVISSLPGRDSYRPQFDISIPPVFPQNSYVSYTNEGKDTLLIPLVNVSGLHKQDVFKDLGDTKATFILECQKDSTKFCSKNGQEVELEPLVQSHQFVLLLDSSPLFPRLLTLSLKHGSIPIIYGDYFVLPFHKSIDWSRVALSPSSFSRIPHILGLSPDEIIERSEYGQLLFRQAFSSSTAVMEQILKELRSRILPSVSSKTDRCYPLLPHLISESSVCGFVVGADSSAIRTVAALCNSPSISRIVVLWNSDDNPPGPDEWLCNGKMLEVTYGGRVSAGIESARKNKRDCNCILFVPERSCPFQDSRLAEAIDIWQSIPHNIVHLSPPYGTCTPPLLLHSIYASHCLLPQELTDLNQKGRLDHLPSIHLTEKADSSSQGNRALFVASLDRNSRVMATPC